MEHFKCLQSIGLTLSKISEILVLTDPHYTVGYRKMALIEYNFRFAVMETWIELLLISRVYYHMLVRELSLVMFVVWGFTYQEND